VAAWREYFMPRPIDLDGWIGSKRGLLRVRRNARKERKYDQKDGVGASVENDW